MFQDFVSSYVALAPSSDANLISPSDALNDPVLAKSVRMIENLCKYFFSARFPAIDCVWGIEDNPTPNACVLLTGGVTEVYITSGALNLFETTRHDLVARGFFGRVVLPSLFGVGATPAIPANDLAETTQLFGLAMLFAHELGHVHDMHFTPSHPNNQQDLVLAEEISADGIAILSGLQLSDAWASDLSNRLHYDETGLRKLGAYLLILANALLDSIKVDETWEPSARASHPRGVMRLVSTCVHINDHFEDVAEGFGVEVFDLVARTLKDLEGLPGTSSYAYLARMLEHFDGDLVQRLYEELEVNRQQRAKHPS